MNPQSDINSTIFRNCLSLLRSLTAILLLLAGPGLARAVVTVEAGASAAEGQKVIDSLPAGRETVATVKLEGAFAFDHGLVLPSFTRLDLSEARIQLAAHATADALLTNADHEAGNVHIEVVGGRLIGPGPNKKATQGIFFARVSQCRLFGLEVSNFSQDGIRLSGLGQHTRKIFVSDVYCHDNGDSGLNIMWAIREIVVSNVIVSNNRVGLRSDHSEGSYVNVTADGNREWGIFIRNVFGNHYTNLTASRNGGAGIYVWGMVSSRGTSWSAHNNGQHDNGTMGDIVFTQQDDLSYGRTSKALVSGISAGFYKQFGGRGRLPHGVYFEGDARGVTYDQVKLIGGTSGETKDTFVRLPSDAEGLTVDL